MNAWLALGHALHSAGVAQGLGPQRALAPLRGLRHPALRAGPSRLSVVPRGARRLHRSSSSHRVHPLVGGEGLGRFPRPFLRFGRGRRRQGRGRRYHGRHCSRNLNILVKLSSIGPISCNCHSTAHRGTCWGELVRRPLFDQNTRSRRSRSSCLQ